jgi:hypothetical protein
VSAERGQRASPPARQPALRTHAAPLSLSKP